MKAYLAQAQWLLLAIVGLALGIMPGLARAALVRNGTPSVAVHAVGPANIVKIDMSSGDLAISEEGGKIMFASDLRQLKDNSVELRTKHMQEEFEASKYPSVVLTVNRSEVRWPPSDAPVTADVPGVLLLHGVTRPVQVHYTVTPAADGYHVTGSVAVDYTEFLGRKITRFGVSVQPKVTIEARFVASESQQQHESPPQHEAP